MSAGASWMFDSSHVVAVVVLVAGGIVCIVLCCAAGIAALVLKLGQRNVELVLVNLVAL